jgi:putative drug exporter of the RND superfamily
MLISLAQFCTRRRKAIIAAWIASLFLLGTLLGVAGSAFSNSNRLPASDSATAYALLTKAGDDAASGTPGIIVWHSTTVSAVSSSARATIVPMLHKVAGVRGVKEVISPFTRAGAAEIAKDGHTAYATVIFSSTIHAGEATSLAKSASNAHLSVETGDTAFTKTGGAGASDVVGVLAALLILLLVFRSAWAALLPIITGVAGVGISTLVVVLLSHAVSIPSVAPELSALIGLGVGIDYALLVVNRHRKALRAGVDVPEAIGTAMNTSGRAVLFAGGTVVIALLGMLVLNAGFLSGLAVAASVTVAFTVTGGVTLLPALLATVGRKVLPKSERTAAMPPVSSTARPLAMDSSPSGFFGGWAQVVLRRPVVTGGLALIALVALASPVLGMRLGSADASSDTTGSVTRSYYDTMSSSFGDGFQSQLLLVAQTPDAQARTAWLSLVRELPTVKGIASVSTPTELSDATLSYVEVTPATTAQAQATSTLVNSLRSRSIKHAEAGTQLQVHVGGTTASTIDYANALTHKLPLFLLIIAGLGFLLLMLAFRSLLIPAIGAIGNILTIGVALGATVALFGWGWGPTLFGVGGPAPLEYVVAILIMGVVFGLSMDYHVFMVSRMHEEWTKTEQNKQAIAVGVKETGPVILTAAGIMACVFASFGLSGMRVTSEFGVGLAAAVLVDVLLVRMTLLPAVMGLSGTRNWVLPSWLDRMLPHLSMEGPVISTGRLSTETDEDPLGTATSETEAREPIAIG